MANVRIIIDGDTVMDANMTLQSGDLPSMTELRQLLEGGQRGQAMGLDQFRTWSMPTIGALTATLIEANTRGNLPDTTITVTTRGKGWTLHVEHA